MLSAYFIGMLMTLDILGHVYFIGMLDVWWCKRDQDLAFSALTATCGWEVFLFGW